MDQPTLASAEPAHHPRTWRRVILQIAALPPAPGKIVSIERGPHVWKATVCAPKWVWTMLLVLVAGSHPWAALALVWLRRFSMVG